jgi:hypothetical protein
MYNKLLRIMIFISFICYGYHRQFTVLIYELMEQKTKELRWLIGKKSYLSIDKLLIYKTVIKPI